MSKLGLSPEDDQEIWERLGAALEADIAAGRARQKQQLRPEHRIGWGDYDWPDWSNSKAIGRQYFFEAIAEVAPQAIADLAATPLALYRETPFRREGDDRPFEYDENEFRHYILGDDPGLNYSPPEEFAPLIQSLRAWGTRY